jgi:ABC-type branched-subunit amino acid transport system substrate-binding protein
VIDDINSTAPDYVVLEMTSTGVISFLAQAANRGLSVPVAGQGLLPVLTGQLSADQVSNLPDLFYTGMRYHHQIDNQRNTDYVDGWESAHGGVPGVLAGMTYGGLEFLVEVLSAADDVSTDSFVDTAEGFAAETDRCRRGGHARRVRAGGSGPDRGVAPAVFRDWVLVRVTSTPVGGNR